MTLRYLFPLICLLWACQPQVEKAPESSLETTLLPDSILFAGQLNRIEAFPSQFVAARNVDIWLPPGFTPKNHYPVLYMHDGQMLFDSTSTWNKQEWGVDETLSRLISEKKIPPVMVVGVWNGGADRHADYFPQKPFESLPQAFQDSLLDAGQRSGGAMLFSTKVQSDAYLRFLTEELKPYIDSHYPTRPQRQHTFIAGSSMGGLISMYALCEYPNVFAGAACLSTHWPGIFTLENNPIPDAFVSYFSANLPDPATHRIYFDHGTETLDALYPAIQQRVDTVLLARYPEEAWMSQQFPGENHSETAWRKRLDIPMQFLMEE